METKVIRYKTEGGVCSKEMIIEVNGDVITNVQIIGGCPGNTLGLSILLKGMKIDDAIERLQGIDCRNKGTSCPDQVSKALKLFGSK